MALADEGAAQGLALTANGHVTRLKWHRLRRRMADPLFSADVLAEGFRLGASMELDLRVRADGGFVLLHDEELEGETDGRGLIAKATADDLRSVHFAGSDRPVTLTEDLESMLGNAHPDALLQFDMKDDMAAVGARGIAHLAAHFAAAPCPLIVSADSLELIVAVRDALPGLLRGIDPTNKLVDLWHAGGLTAVEADLLADLRGPTEPDTVYLHWQLVLDAAAKGLDLIALCHSEGKRVDAWTYTLENPAGGFSDEEWVEFSTLMSLRPDQITTDEAVATERAWKHRTS